MEPLQIFNENEEVSRKVADVYSRLLADGHRPWRRTVALHFGLLPFIRGGEKTTYRMPETQIIDGFELRTVFESASTKRDIDCLGCSLFHFPAFRIPTALKQNAIDMEHAYTTHFSHRSDSQTARTEYQYPKDQVASAIKHFERFTHNLQSTAAGALRRLSSELDSGSPSAGYCALSRALDYTQRVEIGLAGESLLRSLGSNKLLSESLSEPSFQVPWVTVCGASTGLPFSARRERGNLFYMDMLVAGAPKLWVMIPPSQASAFIAALKAKFKNSTMKWQCSQSVEHLNVWPHTDWLEEKGIVYTVVWQQRGDVLLLSPGTFFYGISLGPNISEHLHYADDSWKKEEVREKGFRYCVGTCDKYDSMFTAVNVETLRTKAPVCLSAEEQAAAELEAEKLTKEDATSATHQEESPIVQTEPESSSDQPEASTNKAAYLMDPTSTSQSEGRRLYANLWRTFHALNMSPRSGEEIARGAQLAEKMLVRPDCGLMPLRHMNSGPENSPSTQQASNFPQGPDCGMSDVSSDAGQPMSVEPGSNGRPAPSSSLTALDSSIQTATQRPEVNLMQYDTQHTPQFNEAAVSSAATEISSLCTSNSGVGVSTEQVPRSSSPPAPTLKIELELWQRFSKELDHLEDEIEPQIAGYQPNMPQSARRQEDLSAEKRLELGTQFGGVAFTANLICQYQYSEVGRLVFPARDPAGTYSDELVDMMSRKRVESEGRILHLDRRKRERATFTHLLNRAFGPGVFLSSICSSPGVYWRISAKSRRRLIYHLKDHQRIGRLVDLREVAEAIIDQKDAAIVSKLFHEWKLGHRRE